MTAFVYSLPERKKLPSNSFFGVHAQHRMGGIQIGNTSENVTILQNTIIGGYGNGEKNEVNECAGQFDESGDPSQPAVSCRLRAHTRRVSNLQ